MKRFALALAAVGTLALFTMTSANAAAPTAKASSVANDYHVHYQVLYFHGHHWYVYGTYSYHGQADRVAHHLRHDGYQISIRVIH